MRRGERQVFLRELAHVACFGGVSAKTLALVMMTVNEAVNVPPLDDDAVLRIAADAIAERMPTADDWDEFLRETLAEVVE